MVRIRKFRMDLILFNFTTNMKVLKKIEEVPFEKAEYCIFDFETTGTSAHRDKVIEIGMVKLKNGKVVDTFTSYINPGRQIPFFITSLTGITNTDVADAPYFDEVYQKIKDFVGDTILAAHNLSFDMGFLRQECTSAELEMINNHSICTLKLARKVYPAAPSKSLGKLVTFLKIRHRDVHRGLGDANATAKLFTRMFKTLREDHNIDTISDLLSFQNEPSVAQPYKIVKKKLVDDLTKLPDLPGVYFFKNSKGDVIYIGKAKSLKDRVKNHFMSNALRKSKKIVQAASTIEFQITNSELTALIAEADRIKFYNPRFNTMLKKFPNSYFIRVKHSHRFPNVEVATSFDFDGNDYYGPYPNRETTNKMKDIIDRTFQIRECSDKELGKGKKCYLNDIERCLAPCLAGMNEVEYKDELANVHEFLSGHNQSAVNRLLQKMKELSEKQKFEEAAQVRDIVQNILNQLQRSSILAEPMNKANVMIEISSSPKNDYILLLEGKIYFKNWFLEKSELYDTALEDYFNSTRFTSTQLEEKDLERLKIALSWLVKNRTQIKVHYLAEYKSKEELALSLLFPQNA